MKILAQLDGVIVNPLTKDTLVWTHSKVGMYTVKSCYLNMSNSCNFIKKWRWKLLLKVKIPTKIACFSWTALSGRCFNSLKLDKEGCLTQRQVLYVLMTV